MINEKYLKRMRELLKNDYNNYIASTEKEVKRGLVLNSNKIDKTKFEENINISLQQLEFDDCYKVMTDEKLGNSVLHHAGAFYLQEPSAMVAGYVLPFKVGDLVLDACASPGGKTFQIAKRLNGVLVSNEIDYDRAKVLSSNIERLGLKNVVVTNFDSETLAKNYVSKFDAVLVDAPCSGEGMFRRSDVAINQWSEEYVEICANRQLEILNNINKTLKVGGYLVYSTCTFSLEENEKIVSYLIDMGYELLPIKIKEGKKGVNVDDKDMSKVLRFYPQDEFGEGQFVALLKKTKGEDEYKFTKARYESLGSIEKKLVKEFCERYMTKDWFTANEKCLIKKLDAVFYCPRLDLIVDNKKVLNYGVKIGNIVKNRFEPSHNLFTAFGCDFINQIELTEEEAVSYIKKQTIPTTATNGWACLKYLNCPLAGGKVVNGMIKNHYPKGLILKG